jgi:glutaminyl-tRNA synthetase
LFTVPQPGTGERDFLEELNSGSLRVVTGYVEPYLTSAKGDDRFQFERHGYFVAERRSERSASPNTYGRVTSLKDSWSK